MTKNNTNYCPFCDEEVITNQKVDEYDYWYVLEDIYPVSEGHRLVVPKRHVPSLIGVKGVDREEWNELYDVIRNTYEILDISLSPAGYNFGVNQGKAAGQTVFHLHVHVIPRYEGDMKDPRGGVRGVIPEKQKY